MKNTFLSIDLGAGSCRAMLGELSDGVLSLHEIHRFENEPLEADGHGSWNIESLYSEIRKSLVIIADKDLPVESIGITTWGSDFSLMSEDGIPMQPFVTDDINNEGSVEAFTARMSVDKIYGQTGIPVSRANSLFQLYALKLMGFEPLKKARQLLFMPDIFNYLLTGVILTESSMAGTSQLYNPIKRVWDHDFFRTLGVSTSLMARLAEAGSIIGSISNQVSYETGIARIPVVAVASHDMASAVASLPLSGNGRSYLIIGNGFQMGYESAQAVITKKAQQLGIASQAGAGRMFRISKSLGGLRLLEECRKQWNDKDYTLAGMVALATEARPFAAFIDTDQSTFQDTADMPAEIAAYCKSTSQYIPQTHGEIIRTLLESLAFKFRLVMGEIELLRGIKTEALYLAGPGALNGLLCRFTADCCRIPVMASPNDATATGNILVQAIALGIVKNVAEMREIAERSFPPTRYEPSETDLWSEAFLTWVQVTG